MPMYEYRCKSCGHEFEELVFGDQLPACPVCHGKETEKPLSRPCRYCEGGGFEGMGAPAPSGGGCAGCSGGNCSSCH